MKSERFRVLLVIAVLLLGVILFLVYKKQRAGTFVSPPDLQQQHTEKYATNYTRVLQGHEFDLKLVNKQRIHAVLCIKTPPEALFRVVDYINSSRNPEVVIYERRKDGTCVVDLLFEGVSLTRWLQQQGLAWE